LTPICTKSFVRWSFAPGPTGGAYSAPLDPLALITEAASKGKGGERREREGKGRGGKRRRGEGGSSIFALGRN